MSKPGLIASAASGSTQPNQIGFNQAGTLVTNYPAYQSAGGVVRASTQTPEVTVTFGATTAINCQSGNVFGIAMTGNITTLNVNNPTNGQTINVFFSQDATGGRTVAWPASFKWVAGAAGVLSTGASKEDLLVATYRASTGNWYCYLTNGFSNPPGSLLLMHFDGTNGSTSYIDVYGNTFAGINIAPNAQISTAASMFGGSSLNIQGGGSNNSAGYVNSSTFTGCAFGTGDFTVECWFNFTTYGEICGADGSFGWDLALNASGYIDWYSSPQGMHHTGAVNYQGTGWHAVAVVRFSSTTTIYIDGTSVLSFADSSNYTFNTSFDIGGNQVGNPNGYIDELRISNVARYTSNYTPSGPFAS